MEKPTGAQLEETPGPLGIIFATALRQEPLAAWLSQDDRVDVSRETSGGLCWTA